MKRKHFIISVVAIVVFFLCVTNHYGLQQQCYYAKSSVRNFFNSDKKEILEYQQYRIVEFRKYHNYDTSYAASAEDWYRGHDTTPYGGDDSWANNN